MNTSAWHSKSAHRETGPLSRASESERELTQRMHPPSFGTADPHR